MLAIDRQKADTQACVKCEEEKQVKYVPLVFAVEGFELCEELLVEGSLFKKLLELAYVVDADADDEDQLCDGHVQEGVGLAWYRWLDHCWGHFFFWMVVE